MEGHWHGAISAPQKTKTPTVEGPKSNRLSEAMGNPVRGAFRTVTPLPCNISAIRACRDFAVGREYLVALVGPSGWGKTLLLQSVADWMTKEYRQEIAVVKATDWLKNPPRPESLVPVILDDIQEAVRQPRYKHQLKTILERRIRLRRPTLVSLTAWNGPASLASSVPYDREWTLGTVNEPSADEKKVIIREMSEFENLRLSPELIGLMARFINGNGCSINGALRCLSLVKADWCQAEDVCRACGVLMPFLVLHENWDPRDEVVEAVDRVAGRHGLPPVEAQALACYLMIGLVQVGEDIVARHMRLSPAEVYAHYTRTIAQIDDSKTASLVEECRRETVRAFGRF